MVAFGETLRKGGYQDEKRVASKAVVAGVRGGRGGGVDCVGRDVDAVDEAGTGILTGAPSRLSMSRDV